MNRRLFFICTLLVLSSCNGDNDKIGSTIKGTRVAVIEETKPLEADKDLANIKPTLPRQVVNLSWPQTGYDSEHLLPYSELSPHLHVLWKSSIGEGSSSSFKLLAHPVVDHGTIFTMDSQGLIRSISTASGNLNWEVVTTPKDSDGPTIGGGLAVDGHNLFATTGDGEVFALDAERGTLTWKQLLLKPLRAAPTIADNRVYVVSIDNELTALDALNGEILWHQSGIAESATLMGASNPAVANDSVIVAYNSGEIFDLRVQNGRSSWSYSLTTPTQVGALPAIADIRGLPVIDHGRVYAISHSGRMASIEIRSGDRVWESDIGGIDTPVIAGDTIFVYGGDSQLMALTKESGRTLWVQPLAKRVDMKDKDSDKIVWTGPVLAGSRLWMVNSKGQLASFSPIDGAPIDTLDLGGSIYLSPVIVDHVMYVLKDNGDLLALR